ncbi:MAG: hypothetical protein VCB26_14265, partial [Candidatus Hydrogenedentota bacterium]
NGSRFVFSGIMTGHLIRNYSHELRCGLIHYRCDGCGKDIAPKSLRYTVNIDVRAAYDTLEVGLADLVKDHREEILALIESLSHKSAEEVETSVYKNAKFDLCPSCQKAYVANPLHFHPEQQGPDSDLDIDAFLRSLGLNDS